MDYVTPVELIGEIVRAAKRKAGLNVSDMLLRGALSGVFLGFATSMVFVVQSQGIPPLVGAVLFPVGFVMLVLLGLELATGNFAILPVAVAAGEVTPGRMLRNWFWVYTGNLLGSAGYALLFYLAITNCGANNGGPVGDLLRAAAQKKTLGYMSAGGAGWATALVKAVLCNWMVTVGACLAMVSKSTIGKIVAMWLPILTFFAQGFEHSVVNMFVIPAGMMLRAPVSAGTWWLWNQIPVTIGNILSGSLCTGLALYATFRPAADPKPAPAEPEMSFAQERV
ncbi:MAG TPA: formate/nitrite transporter family protein [Verrucomicrobiae bacterium]|nr:formate/nitrite transporter family protein [Verrucomicrobiae bacterium]